MSFDPQILLKSIRALARSPMIEMVRSIFLLRPSRRAKRVGQEQKGIQVFDLSEPERKRVVIVGLSTRLRSGSEIQPDSLALGF